MIPFISDLFLPQTRIYFFPGQDTGCFSGADFSKTAFFIFFPAAAGAWVISADF
jgi:hypothetical protein